MRFKIKNATPQNIAFLLENMMRDNGLTMHNANVYINFYKDESTIIPLDEDNKEITCLAIKFAPQQVAAHDISFKIPQILTQRELQALKDAQMEKWRMEQERLQAERRERDAREAEAREKRWVGIGRRTADGFCKLYWVEQKPDSGFVKGKESRYGYEVLAFIYVTNATEIKSRIYEEIQKENLVTTNNYFTVTEDFMKWFMSLDQADEIWKNPLVVKCNNT